jgi:hypothetical protein
MAFHLEDLRLEELSKPGGPHLTEEELEHIADCRECGERVFDKVFPPGHKFRTDKATESDGAE